MSKVDHPRKRTVEECRSITMPLLKKERFLINGIRYGRLDWECQNQGEISLGVSTMEPDEAYAELEYTFINQISDESDHLQYKIKLTWTPCYFGGRRWWFVCPLTRDGKACGRRIGVLYLTNSKHFGCRLCNNLTYRSCREHDKRMSPLIKDPGLIMSYLESKNNTKTLLALKASIKIDKN